jgi:ABC-type transporter Mla MlaB component
VPAAGHPVAGTRVALVRPMLRITRTTIDGATLLKLEGKLLAPWTGELLEQCGGSVGRVQLDLARVSYVDGAGVALLNELRERGATIVACSGFVAELLHAELS